MSLAFQNSVEEHVVAVRELVERLWRPGIDEVPLGAALGRTLALDVATPIDLPPFDNSQMDGFAIRASSGAGAAPGSPVTLPVTAHIAAGDPRGTLAAGVAAAIMTGAPMPTGADAVVPVEEVLPRGFDDATEIVLHRPVDVGWFVRRRGSDLTAGTTLLPAGTRLGPGQLGALAASGIVAVPVRSRPRVLVVSTGAELTAPGSVLRPGQIYDANVVSLSAAVTEAGGVALSISVPSDDPRMLLAAVDSAAVSTGGGPIDLIVTSGGVSAGAHEVVRDAFGAIGVKFGSVAMQPGGPQGFGSVGLDSPGGGTRETPVLCFPGNPVSVLVSFELFLRPLLAGPRPRTRARLEASASSGGSPLGSPGGKRQLRRARLRDDGGVEFVGGASSHLIAAYARSNALAHIPAGVTAVQPGDELEVWRIDG